MQKQKISKQGCTEAVQQKFMSGASRVLIRGMQYIAFENLESFHSEFSDPNR